MKPWWIYLCLLLSSLNEAGNGNVLRTDGEASDAVSKL